MNAELLVTCDFAQDNAGKLTVVGCFDTINAKALPVKHPFMSIAARIRFMVHELGKHSVRLAFKDPQGGQVLPPFEGGIDVSSLGTDTTAFVFVLNNIGVEFRHPGKHEIALSVDGKPLSAIPLYVRKA